MEMRAMVEGLVNRAWGWVKSPKAATDAILALVAEDRAEMLAALTTIAREPRGPVGKEGAMVGQIHYVEGRAYVQVNDAGTLEILPYIRWYKQIYLHVLSFMGRLHLEDVRRAWR